MTTRLHILRDEIVNRLENAAVTLDTLAARTTDEGNRKRLEEKAAGVRTVLENHTLRLQNLRNEDDTITLAAIIKQTAELNGYGQAGADLAAGYLIEYLR